MEKIRKTIYVTLSVVAVLVAIASLLSIFRNTESRFLKMLDFPRIQLFLTALISLILLVILTRRWQWYDYLLVAGLLGGLAMNGSYLINYTTLVPVAVSAAGEREASGEEFSILLANVKMKNKNAAPLLELVEDKKPSLILAMEVDDWWENKLEAIEEAYPYAQETINEVAYGMTLYSKFPLQEVDVRYLQNEKVPSFECTITLSNGKAVTFHAVHPVPPTHFKNLPDNAGQREMAMQKLGERLEGRKLPTIVAGDINDVVWSYTDKLTGTENTLHDVRVGRGFYNSYNARNFLADGH